jgi:hypothetical protein
MECVMGDKIAIFFLKINQFCGLEHGFCGTGGLSGAELYFACGVQDFQQ